VLLAHAATVATRRSGFPADEPLDAAELPLPALPRYEEVRCAPSLRCRRTADALGLPAAVDDGLTGLDHGSWAGRALDDVAAADPDGLTRWLTDPEAVPHGGESMAAFVGRVGGWLRTVPNRPRGLLAVVDPAVVRAALAHALGAPVTAVWRIDVDPLSVAVLAGEPGRWNLRELRPGPGRGANGTPP
jgi:broad specificity phosphatase PhoE